MTLEQWIDRYETKSGDKHLIPDGYQTLYDEQKGYAQVRVDGEFISVLEVCGDGRYWYNKAIEIARDNKCRWLHTFCVRNILPYIRLMGGKWTEKSEMPTFHDAIKGQGVNHLGNKFIVIPAWYDNDKKAVAYNVYSEVIKHNED